VSGSADIFWPRGSEAKPFRPALEGESTRPYSAGLASKASTLRLLDVAAWMRGSGYKHARRVRKELGL
jgi:hypothetical protein